MKKLKKVLIIITLSLFLTSAITPQHKKEADAFVITGSIALGALAVAGVGAISYANRDIISEAGTKIYQKLQADGIDVTDMYSRNQFGINQNVINRMAESIEEIKVQNATKSYTTEAISLNSSQSYYHEFDQSFIDNIHRLDDVYMTVTQLSIVRDWNDIDYQTMGLMSRGDPLDTSNTTVKGTLLSKTDTQIIRRFDASLFTSSNLREMRIQPFGGAAEFQLSFQSYRSLAEAEEQNVISALDSYEDITGYTNAITNIYGNAETVSIDYEKLENIMTNADSQPITIDNLDSIVSGLDNLQDSIDDSTAQTVGMLNTIWNGIKNIPDIMATNATAVLGGISSLGDTILDGLSTGLDNLSKANDQLWEDAGVVWSGISDNINALGQTLSDVLTPPLTAMNDRLYDFTGVMADLPNTIRTGITDGMANIGEKLNDLSSTVKEIPSAVSTSVTDTWSSAFAVPDNYFIDRTSAIMEIINPKLPQFPSKEALFPSDFDEKGDWSGITADFSHYGIGEQMVIDNEAPNYYRRQIKLWISAILYFFTALFIIKKTAGVIRS